MRKPYLLLICLAICCTTTAFAQQTGQHKQTPSPILNQAKEISMVTGMSVERQVQLTDVLMKIDSSRTSFRNQGKNDSFFVSIHDFEREILKFLTLAERVKYNRFRYESLIRREAKDFAEYQTASLDASDLAKEKLETDYFDKSLALLNLSAVGDYSVRKELTHSISSRYDSSIQRGLIAARGDAFFKVQIKKADSIKPFTNAQKEFIHKQFIWNCKEYGDHYFQNFLNALRLVTSDKVYYEYFCLDSVRNIANEKASQELADLNYKYGLSNEILKKITPLLQQKCQREADLIVRYPYGKYRDSLLRESAVYFDADFKRILLIAGYFRITENRFVYAMISQKALNLSASQLDLLASKSSELEVLQYRMRLVDPWYKGGGEEFIFFHLEKILRPGQLDTLIKIESYPSAKYYAERDLRELLVNKLVTNSDSLKVSDQLISYHLLINSLKRRFPEGSPILNKFVKDAENRKPELLRKLEAIKLLKEYEERDRS